MNLELVTVQRGGRSKYAAPFDDHDGYTPEWWNRPMGDGDRTRFIQVLRDGAEVARVELDEVVGIEHYAGTPPLGDRALEIQFIEVKDEQRHLGIGTEVVRSLIALNPDRRLVAYSEGADGPLVIAGLAVLSTPDRTAVLSHAFRSAGGLTPARSPRPRSVRRPWPVPYACDPGHHVVNDVLDRIDQVTRRRSADRQ